jgi:uncharacterized protein YabE (DUF348 family)
LVRPTRVRRLRIRRATHLATIVAGVLLLSWVVALASRKDVTIVVDGQPIAMQTTSGNVRELLASTGLPSNVRVEPSKGTALADGMTVIVSPPPGIPANALTHMVDPHAVGVWVVERSGNEPLGKAASTPDGTAVPADAVGTSSIVSVRAVVSGKVHDVSSNASTVGELLSAMGIHADADDRVAPPPSTPLHDGETVTYDRVDVRTLTEVAAVPFSTRFTYTPNLDPGQLITVRRGTPGLERRTIRTVAVDGHVTSRTVLSEETLRNPVPAHVLSGPMSMTDGALTEPGTGATTQTGVATWYDPPWSGLTAAHPWLPFGTHVTVTDLATGRSVTVVIDDRGPFAPGRIIDLSPEAFSQLAPLGSGVLHVQLSW